MVVALKRWNCSRPIQSSSAQGAQAVGKCALALIPNLSEYCLEIHEYCI